MMGTNKKKGLIRRFQDFLVSYNGKVVLNYAYSWGASIVILGALFKLTHLPGANIMLWIGMGTEVLVFFVSAFDRPYKSYKWESVFPQIKISGANTDKIVADEASQTPITMAYLTKDLPAQQQVEQSKTVARETEKPISVQKPNLVSETLLNDISSTSPEVAEATASYLDKLQSITDSITSNSEDYVEQMQSLNRNLIGINAIYEIQLKSISSQIDTIDKVNQGLLHLKNMYEGSTENSEKFNQESEKMAQQIEELNNVYARMLKAMTVNMNNQQL